MLDTEEMESALASAKQYEQWDLAHREGGCRRIDKAQGEVIALARVVRRVFGELERMNAENEQLKHDSATSLQAAGNIARDRVKDGRAMAEMRVGNAVREARIRALAVAVRGVLEQCHEADDVGDSRIDIDVVAGTLRAPLEALDLPLDQRALVEQLIPDAEVVTTTERYMSTNCDDCRLSHDGTWCLHPAGAGVELDLVDGAPDACPLRKGPL